MEIHLKEVGRNGSLASRVCSDGSKQLRPIYPVLPRWYKPTFIGAIWGFGTPGISVDRWCTFCPFVADRSHVLLKSCNFWWSLVKFNYSKLQLWWNPWWNPDILARLNLHGCCTSSLIAWTVNLSTALFVHAGGFALRAHERTNDKTGSRPETMEQATNKANDWSVLIEYTIVYAYSRISTVYVTLFKCMCLTAYATVNVYIYISILSGSLHVTHAITVCPKRRQCRFGAQRPGHMTSLGEVCGNGPSEGCLERLQTVCTAVMHLAKVSALGIEAAPTSGH